MYIPKRYGESKIMNCPFCGAQAITKNPQKIPTCLKHKSAEILDLKCICGEWLDIREGKYGPYWLCMRCGPQNFKKGLDLNPDWNKDIKKEESGPKEYIIRSDEVDCWF